MAQTTLTIHIQDWPEVKAFLDHCSRRVEILERIIAGLMKDDMLPNWVKDNIEKELAELAVVHVATAMEVALRGIEWSQPEDSCPWCHNTQTVGHAADCGVGNALK